MIDISIHEKFSLSIVMIILTFLTCGLPISASADADVTFHGTLIEAPPCVVNNGEKITVDFGNEVMTTRIDGSNYKQRILFTLDCSEALSAKQTVRISGTATSFDAIAIGTTEQTGLGIAIYYGSERYTLGEKLSFTAPSAPELYAVPVKEEGVSLNGGAFSALASLVVDYQ